MNKNTLILAEAKVKEVNLTQELAKSEFSFEANFAFLEFKKKIILPNMIIIKDYQLNEGQITL